MTLRKLLSEIEFDYKIVDGPHGRKDIQLIDSTGVNLGNIESETFRDAEEVIDRTENYWKDYVIDDAKDRLKLSENATWEDIYKAAALQDDTETDVLRSLVRPATVEIEDFKSVEDTMRRNERHILEDLQANSNDVDSALPKFSRVKVYHPDDYGLLPDGDKFHVLHVLAEYSGNEDEDEVYKQLNDKNFPSEFNGMKVNWTPVSKEQSGSIEQYLENLLKSNEEFERKKESYDINKVIKETVEQTVNENLGSRVESAEDFMNTYNNLSRRKGDMPLEVAEAVMGALDARDIRLFKKDGQLLLRGLPDGKEENALTGDDVVRQADGIISDWISNGNSERSDEVSLARLRWFENGFSFPKENTLDENATERNFKMLQSHFPEITRLESNLISTSMANQGYTIYAKDGMVFVEDSTDQGMELNDVDLPTLAEYAAGDLSLSKEQQDILMSLVPNMGHGKTEEKEMGKTLANEIRPEKEAMDAMTAARLAGLADKAYSAYQLEWLKDKGISLTDIADSMDDIMNADADGKPSDERISAYGALQRVIDEGIGGEMFVSIEEFKDNEFLDKDIVKNLLAEDDYKEYLGYIPKLAEKKDMENKKLDEIDTERMNELAEKAYHKYQYEWLSDRGITLDDITDEMQVRLDDYMEITHGGRAPLSAGEQLRAVIDNGIHGEMFASLSEFKTNEFLDPESIRLGHLLEGHDYEEYLPHIKAYAKDLGVEIEDPMEKLEAKQVDVRRQNAKDYINEMSPATQASVKGSLESLKAEPLDVYFATGEDAKMNAYLVSRADSGSYTTHLINENGLNWGHYDIATKWAAQKQAMTRAAGTGFDNINLVEVESAKGKAPENSRDEVVAQVTWTRQDIVNAIENEKGPDYEVTDKDIDSALDELSPKYMEEKMIETGWDFISEAVTNSLSQDKDIPLHDVFVADKERKVAMSFHPEYVFNEKTGEDDLPNVGITVENTISGLRNSMDKVIPSPYLSEFQQENGGGFFVRNIAAKEGITSEKIESISADEFQKIHEKRELVASPEKQPPVERLLRQTQAILFKKGIEESSGNTDEIFRSAQSILKTFSKEEKNEAKKFFKNFGDIEKTKAANEVTALARFIASSDPAEVMKKYPSIEKKNERKAAKGNRTID